MPRLDNLKESLPRKEILRKQKWTAKKTNIYINRNKDLEYVQGLWPEEYRENHIEFNY